MEHQIFRFAQMILRDSSALNFPFSKEVSQNVFDVVKFENGVDEVSQNFVALEL